MRVNWAVLESHDRRVEAQVWEPDQPAKKAILFCPGFPGVGATVFEQRHAASLVAAGYAVIVLRHGGIILNGPFAPLMVNNGARLAVGRRNGDTHTGGGPASIDDWLVEPLTALGAVAGQFDDLTVIGNSFGALAALWSLTLPGAPLKNVTHILLQAGAQGVSEDGGVTDTMRIWKPEFIAMPHITGKVALNDPHDVAASLLDVYEKLPARVRDLPDRIRRTAIVVAQDEILKPADMEKFNAAVGGNWRVVLDETDRAHPEAGLLAHDMPDWRTEDFLSLL
jgi:pimeloyl-ACP methyl ester carboxylesterase